MTSNANSADRTHAITFKLNGLNYTSEPVTKLAAERLVESTRFPGNPPAVAKMVELFSYTDTKAAAAQPANVNIAIAPFNLEAALAGAPVVTRDGSAVTDLVQVAGISSPANVMGVVDSEPDWWYPDGRYYDHGIHSLDLFMSVERVRKEGWIRLCDRHGRAAVYSTNIEATEEAARATEDDSAFPTLAVVKVEWYEEQ